MLAGDALLVTVHHAGQAQVGGSLNPENADFGQYLAEGGPIELMRMKALTPKVLGKSQDTPCQAPGMLDCGQDTPVRKSSGTETITISNITFSR